MIYSWQMEAWDKLHTDRARLPHGLLLQGRRGIGKLDFAQSLAQSLLCEQPNEHHQACGICQSCNWYSQGNHPDFRLIEPEDGDSASGDESAPADTKSSKKQYITIHQVRSLTEFSALSSHMSGLRVVLIHPAEALNIAAANALLKMLEEPTVGLMFILVTHQPDRLLPTIRSRCRAISLTLPSKPAAMSWLSEKGVEDAEAKLAYAGGAPLLVLEQAQSSDADEKRFLSIITMLSSGRKLDPSTTASILAKLGMFEGLNLLQKWIFDLVCYKMTHQLQFYQGFQDSIKRLAALADIQKVYGYQRKLDEAKKTALHPLNTELQLESLLIQYTQLFTH